MHSATDIEEAMIGVAAVRRLFRCRFNQQSVRKSDRQLGRPSTAGEARFGQTDDLEFGNISVDVRS